MKKFSEHPLVIGLRIFEQYITELGVSSDEERLFVIFPKGTKLPDDQIESLELLGWHKVHPNVFSLDDTFVYGMGSIDEDL